MKQLLSICSILLTVNVFAQTNAPRIVCGNEVFSQILREKYPQLQQDFDQTFDAAQKPRVDDRSPLDIRVVVHIVWNSPEENLPDSVIENQIQVLNEDYNRLNPDTANLRAAFKPVAGNADIHFHLQQVIRIHTTKLFTIDAVAGTLAPELKHDSQGGSDAWDPKSYLNIWVCQIQPLTIFGIPVGQILGFSFPPDGLSNWPVGSAAPTPEEDGVVIDFRAFGRNNPNPLANPAGGGNLDIRGRTPVHEVGHYLGLRHIWGDGGSVFGPNNCDQSDGIDDTPYANAQSDFDCNTTKNTCPQVEMFYNSDMPDLVENYMDYSSETCMNMFTAGQVTHMRNVLAGPRAGLLAPLGTHAADAQPEWRLFPNPAADRLSLTVSLQNPEEAFVQITGADGKLVRTLAPKVYAAGTQQIDIETVGLNVGIYFVSLQTATGRSMRKLEIVR